jgi:hypothetical protein
VGVFLIVLFSFFLRGVSEKETEKIINAWKLELLKMAEQDRESLFKAGAFTK